MAKTYTIKKTHNGRSNYIQGTIEQLAHYFGYLLECGESWERMELAEKNSHRKPTITTEPKTIKSLMKSLEKSVEYTQGGCYHRDSHELVDAVPEGVELSDLAKESA